MGFGFNIAPPPSLGNCEMSLSTDYLQCGVRRIPLALILVVEYFVLLEGPSDFEGGGRKL